MSLIDSHNLVLRGALVYREPHSEHPLTEVTGWTTVGKSALPSSWAHRQRAPGAVIPPTNSTVSAAGPSARDLYAVALDITAGSAKGGWAIGQEITYRQGGAEYKVRSYAGYALAPPAKDFAPCQAQTDAIGKVYGDSG